VRSHWCGQISSAEVGQAVQLCGWVEYYRDHGGVIFFDLRDYTGRVQIVSDPERTPASYPVAQQLRLESVVQIAGTVSQRPTGSENPRLPTGALEIYATELVVLNPVTRPLPFLPSGGDPVREELRLKYRYLTIRGDKLQQNLRLRHQVVQSIRRYLEDRLVVAIDFGIKHNILRRLASYGCRVVVVPATTPATEILAYDPDGIFLSNGPGDPAAVREGIATTQALLKTGRPLFGICLGHQILGLAMGSQTFKLKFGHHGLNHPAGLGNQVAISSQNHGFALDKDTLAPELQITDWNLNDQTVAGVRHQELPIFSVQYHPEASPGPHDADYFFAQFVEQMQQYRQRRRG